VISAFPEAKKLSIFDPEIVQKMIHVGFVIFSTVDFGVVFDCQKLLDFL
jgi:hypothetical protein